MGQADATPATGKGSLSRVHWAMGKIIAVQDCTQGRDDDAA